MLRRLLFVFALSLFFAQNANAAYLYIVPDKTSLSAGELSGATIYINSEGKAVNNGEAVIVYKPAQINVESILSSDSILSIWIEPPTFSNSSGQVSFNGGVPNPGYKGTAGKVARIIFKANVATNPSFTFTTESIRANDGLGTEVARHAPSTDAPTATPVATPTTPAPVTPTPVTPTPSGKIPSPVIVFSKDIPSEDVWYNGTSALFSWTLAGDVTAVQTLLGSHADSVPLVVYAPPIKSKNLEKLIDGVWYLHIRAKNATGWGPTTHRKIRIDQSAPSNLSSEVKEGEEGELSLTLSAKDSLSGVKYFEISSSAFSESLKVDAKDGDASVILPNMNSGEQKLILKAYDAAGNSLEKEITVTIKERVFEAPLISPLPETVTDSENLVVEGETAYPNSEVTIFTTNQDGVSSEYKGTTDQNGHFEININALEKGTLTVSAALTKDSKLLSPLSISKIVAIKGNFLKTFEGLFTKLNMVRALLLLAIILIIIILLLLRKIYVLKVHIKDHIHGGAIDIRQVFDIIRKDKANTSAIIEKTKRSLSDEDIKKIKVIDEDLTAAEKYFDAKVKKLEVETKKD